MVFQFSKILELVFEWWDRKMALRKRRKEARRRRK
jgi:hypothetical protein